MTVINRIIFLLRLFTLILIRYFSDKIYVCGGFDGSSRHSTMEFYDQNTDKWTLLDSTSVGREGAGLVSLGDSLYCIGMHFLTLKSLKS